MEKVPQPLLVEVIAYAPNAFYHCTHCEVAFREMGLSNHAHQEQVDSSLLPDLRRDYQALSDWVHELFRLYCDRVVVEVIDAASLEGFLKTLCYNVHRYPALIVGKKRFTGGAFEQASQEIARTLKGDLVVHALAR